MFTIYAKWIKKDENNQIVVVIEPLHHPNLDMQNIVCISPVLNEQLNTHNSLRFAVAPNHPQYDFLTKRLTYIIVYDDGLEIWRGRIISISRGWDNRKIVLCEGELAYLTDTTVRPFTFKGTVAEFVAWLISNHNGQLASGDERRFSSTSNVTVTGNVDVSTNTPKTTWEVITSILLRDFPGYLQTRKDSNGVHIDYLADFSENSGQDIVFGENLIDLQEDVDAANVITKVIPYGARKNKPPVLFKRRSSSSRYFDRFTEDLVADSNGIAGQFLIVANGGAMNSTAQGIGLGSELVTITPGTGGAADYINLPNTTANNKCIWTIKVSTVKFKEDVRVSGSMSETISMNVGSAGGSITIGGGSRSIQIGSGSANNLELGRDGTPTSGAIPVSSSGSEGSGQPSLPIYNPDGTAVIGYAPYIGVSVSSSGSSSQITLTGNGGQTANEWMIENSETGGLLYAPEGESQSSTKPLPTDQNKVWKISNGENGVTITNKVNSDKKFPAAIHGDVDNGFRCYWNASGDTNLPASNGSWDGDRVTVKRCVNESGVHYNPLNGVANSDDLVRSPDALALWSDSSVVGYHVFDEAQTPAELYAMAKEWLAKQFAEALTIEVHAADLSLIGRSSYRLRVGVYARVISSLHEISLRLLCIEKTTYFSEPDKTSITYGAGKKTLSDLQGGLIANVR